jgi:hypothetical protein
MAVGGAAYLVAKAIQSAKSGGALPTLAWKAIYEFDVKDMPVTVAVDSAGKLGAHHRAEGMAGEDRQDSGQGSLKHRFLSPTLRVTGAHRQAMIAVSPAPAQCVPFGNFFHHDRRFSIPASAASRCWRPWSRPCRRADFVYYADTAHVPLRQQERSADPASRAGHRRASGK